MFITTAFYWTQRYDNGWADGYDVTTEVGNITIPSLVLWGAEEGVETVDVADAKPNVIEGIKSILTKFDTLVTYPFSSTWIFIFKFSKYDWICYGFYKITSPNIKIYLRKTNIG